MIRLARVIDDHLIISRRSRSSFARELGWNRSTVTRFLSGNELDMAHLQSLLVWLFQDISQVEPSKKGE